MLVSLYLRRPFSQVFFLSSFRWFKLIKCRIKINTFFPLLFSFFLKNLERKLIQCKHDSQRFFKTLKCWSKNLIFEFLSKSWLRFSVQRNLRIYPIETIKEIKRICKAVKDRWYLPHIDTNKSWIKSLRSGRMKKL